jgi:exopolysaccharide production protein ExoQ
MSELGTLVCAAGIFLLFWLDRDGAPEVSHALWIPFAWMFLAGSRMVTEWLNPGAEPESTDVLYDGSPLDRFVITALLLVGLAVLLRRGPRVNAILRANWPILLFFAFAAFSVAWSDFPEVAIKRWIKACGNVVMVLVVLTEANPSAAVKRLFARLAFVLLPLSMLLIRYYPSLGRGYHTYSWTTFYSGVSTGKNGLGYICLVLGLASAWRLLETRRWRWSPEWAEVGVSPAAMRQTRRRILIAHGIVLVFALWLFRLSDSVTPLVCGIVATTLMVIAGSHALVRRPTGLHVVFATAVLVLIPGWVMFDVFTEAFGRDPTLTGRTELWQAILRVVVDPVLGSGFESFWLGDRMEQIAALYWWRPNQAHNGYLEIYLNLGLIGLALLALVIVRGYSGVIRTLHYDPEFGRLKLGFLTAAVLYNLTEAAFKGMHLVWIAFFFAAIHVPWRTSETTR